MRRGSRVNFMKLTLLQRQCIYRKVDRVTTKGWKVAGSKPGTHKELCGATPMVLSYSAHVSTRRPKATKCHCSTAGQSQKLRTRTRASLDKTTPEEGGSPRPRAFLLSERDPLCRCGSRVNFMKLTLLRRRQSGSNSASAPAKRIAFRQESSELLARALGHVCGSLWGLWGGGCLELFSGASCMGVAVC